MIYIASNHIQLISCPPSTRCTQSSLGLLLSRLNPSYPNHVVFLRVRVPPGGNIPIVLLEGLYDESIICLAHRLLQLKGQSSILDISLIMKTY